MAVDLIAVDSMATTRPSVLAKIPTHIDLGYLPMNGRKETIILVMIFKM